MIKYRVWEVFNSIEKVEIEKETPNFVYIDGGREAKSGWRHYYDTWEEAHAYLLRKAQIEVADANLKLQQVEAMSPPEEE